MIVRACKPILRCDNWFKSSGRRCGIVVELLFGTWLAFDGSNVLGRHIGDIMSANGTVVMARTDMNITVVDVLVGELIEETMIIVLDSWLLLHLNYR
jgi:hypothetical protein